MRKKQREGRLQRLDFDFFHHLFIVVALSGKKEELKNFTTHINDYASAHEEVFVLGKSKGSTSGL